jgi:hypothetical protein
VCFAQQNPCRKSLEELPLSEPEGTGFQAIRTVCACPVKLPLWRHYFTEVSLCGPARHREPLRSVAKELREGGWLILEDEGGSINVCGGEHEKRLFFIG